MESEAIPDLEGWEAYCEVCKAFREARRAQERDVGDGTEYFEFVCNTCHSILLTFQRFGTERPESKPAEIHVVERAVILSRNGKLTVDREALPGNWADGLHGRAAPNQ